MQDGKMMQEGNRAHKAGWGEVFELMPGIGVELTDKEDPAYLSFIEEQIHIICSTEVGKAIFKEFAPNKDTQNVLTAEGQEAYKGLTVVIGQPSTTASAASKERTIHTATFAGRDAKGKRVFNTESSQIPRINFYARPNSDQKVEMGNTAVLVTSEGIQNHKDFPNITQPFDVTLFHELMHAYLWRIGVAQRIDTAMGKQVKNEKGEVKSAIELLQATGEVKVKLGDQGMPAEALEEELVTGLVGGKKMLFSENVYRVQMNYDLRRSYLDVGILVDKLDMEGWVKEIKGIKDMSKEIKDIPTQIYLSIIAAGLPPELANFIAGTSY